MSPLPGDRRPHLCSAMQPCSGVASPWPHVLRHLPPHSALQLPGSPGQVPEVSPKKEKTPLEETSPCPTPSARACDCAQTCLHVPVPHPEPVSPGPQRGFGRPPRGPSWEELRVHKPPRTSPVP